MKIYILDIQDGNGCRLVTKLSKDDVLQAAQDWLRTRAIGMDKHYESWFNDCMDTIQSGQELRLANMDYIVLMESEIDLGFVIEAMEDAQLSMGRQHELLSEVERRYGGVIDVSKDFQTIKNKHLATEQVLHLTIKKLKGQP